MYSNGKKLSADRADIYVVDSTQLESQVNLNVNDHEQIIKSLIPQHYYKIFFLST